MSVYVAIRWTGFEEGFEIVGVTTSREAAKVLVLESLSEWEAARCGEWYWLSSIRGSGVFGNGPSGPTVLQMQIVGTETMFNIEAHTVQQ